MARASTILVLDDEEAVRNTITRVLRAEGHAVIPIGRGVSAHWCVETHGPAIDLVIVDFAPPEADDYHLGIPIGALLAHTPVLFVSARPHEEGLRRGLLLPGTPFLRKPISPGPLSRKVRQLLERRSMPPAA